MRLRRFLVENGLSLTMLILFCLSLVGQHLSGWKSFNQELHQHGLPPITLSDYHHTGHFVESVFENWESEFLQMGLFVVLSACLYQRGSSESNPLPDEVLQKTYFPSVRYFKNQKFLRLLYENSLSLALFLLFVLSFFGHIYGTWMQINEEHLMNRPPQVPLDFMETLWNPEFWFQSFQNWQSEFLSVGILILLSIFLRQKGSAQSKEVDAPHRRTGTT